MLENIYLSYKKTDSNHKMFISKKINLIFFLYKEAKHIQSIKIYINLNMQQYRDISFFIQISKVKV